MALTVSKLDISKSELMVIVMGLQVVLEDTQAEVKGVKFNTAALKALKEIETAATSALKKLATVTNDGVMFAQIEPFNPGDEKDFIEPQKE